MFANLLYYINVGYKIIKNSVHECVFKINTKKNL